VGLQGDEDRGEGLRGDEVQGVWLAPSAVLLNERKATLLGGGVLGVGLQDLGELREGLAALLVELLAVLVAVGQEVFLIVTKRIL